MSRSSESRVGGCTCSAHLCWACCFRRRIGIGLGAGFALLCLLSSSLYSRDLDQDLRDFMRFAVESPKSYGFGNEQEARQARLGRAYALYVLSDWTSTVSKLKSNVKADPKLALDKVYTVLNEAGEPRCVLIYGRKSDREEFRPMVLGQPYLAVLLSQLEQKPDPENHVLIIKPSTRTFHYANTQNPEVIHDFDEPLN